MKTFRFIKGLVLCAVSALSVQCAGNDSTGKPAYSDSLNANLMSTREEVDTTDSTYFDEFTLLQYGPQNAMSGIYVEAGDNQISVCDSFPQRQKYVYVKRDSFWVNYMSKHSYESELLNYPCKPSRIAKYYSRYIFTDSIYELERVFFRGRLFSTNVYIKTPKNNKCIYNTGHDIGVDTLTYLRQVFFAKSRHRWHENANLGSDGKVHVWEKGDVCYPTLPKHRVWPGINQDRDIVDERMQKDGVCCAPDVMPHYSGDDAQLFKALKIGEILKKYADKNDRPVFRFLVNTKGGILDVQVLRTEQSEVIRKLVLKHINSTVRFSVASNRGEPVTVWYTMGTKYDKSMERWSDRNSLRQSD